ncbi:MAG: methylmalonyl-CoA mutase family protein [Xanthobacteraceae bacterium]
MSNSTTGETLALAAEFPRASFEQWRALVEQALKGAQFEKKLVSHSYDALPIGPLYQGRREALPVTGRVPGLPWTIMQRVDHPDAVAANGEALHELENGAGGLSLVFAGALGARGYGLTLSKAEITRVLDGVALEAGICIDLDLGAHPEEAVRLLAHVVKERGIRPQATHIRFGYDPLSAAARAGMSPQPWSAAVKTLTATVSELAGEGYAGPFLCPDGRVIHDAGGSEAQELAFALAAAVEYLRALETGGVAADRVAGCIYFRLSADANQFLSTIKFRALRKLWSRVQEVCGIAPAPALIAADTAWRMMTKRDPYVNILRSTIAVAAAGLGGADAITVQPFTLPLGLPDRFARRIARNTQLILLEETHLAKVGDPGAGAGAVEDLTDQLCRAAWTLFQEIEATGGAFAALKAGLVQGKVAAVRAARERAVAHRKEPLTGTTDFPALDEPSVAVLAPSSAALASSPAVRQFAPMTPGRLAEPFEQLRDQSDAVLARTGVRPRVFLANLGKPSDFTARATFAKNFFEAGGIEAVSSQGHDEPEALAAAFTHSEARLACLCSSDALYEREGESAVLALKAAGAERIYLAGSAAEHGATLRQAGVNEFIHPDCDALTLLQAAHADLSVQESESASVLRGLA